MTGSLVKLVRDGYGRESGRAVFREAPLGDVLAALRAKLLEEVGEYLESREVGELVDILEVLIALVHMEHGSTLDELLKLAEEKRELKGGFRHGLCLYIEPELGCSPIGSGGTK